MKEAIANGLMGITLLVTMCIVPRQSYAALVYTTINVGTALATVDTDTGLVTIIGAFGYSETYGNAFDLDGTMYATLGATKLGRVNLSTGAATVLGPLPTSMYAIEFDSGGTLYGLGWNGWLYRLDKTNGSGVAIGYTGIGSTMDIAFDSGDRLYATTGGRLYRIDTSNGNVLSNIPTTLGASNMGIMFDKDDVLWATLHTSNSALYRLDPITGVATLVHNSGMYYPHGGDIFIALDEEGPVTSTVLAAPNPVPVGMDIVLTANVDDSTTGGSNILEANYTINGGSFFPMDAQDGNFDSVTENVSAVIPAFTEAGVHEICVDGTDVEDSIGQKECIFLVVYDPSAGFVTGGGWINSPEGAYTPDSTLVGKANFGFVSKYKKGANVPTGVTEFQFKVAGLNFHSDNYQWLVISGARAQFKGIGTINGVGYYDFLLTAIDGQISGGGGIDKFRMKIWDQVSGLVIYDNKLGSDDYSNDATAVGGGSIVIHTK